MRDTFRREFKKVPKSRSGDGAEQAPRYLGTWPHFDAMLFLRSVITPRPTEGNVEDPDFSNIFATGAQFQEEADAYESDSESAQASSCERNETFDNRNSRGTLSKKLQNSFTDVAGPINATFSPRSKNVKGSPPRLLQSLRRNC